MQRGDHRVGLLSVAGLPDHRDGTTVRLESLSDAVAVEGMIIDDQDANGLGVLVGCLHRTPPCTATVREEQPTRAGELGEVGVCGGGEAGAAVLRGGSAYQPQTSHWYFPPAYQLDQHGKYLLMSPGKDRSGMVGFRCVVDAG